MTRWLFSGALSVSPVGHPQTQPEPEFLISWSLEHGSRKHKFWQRATGSDGNRASFTFIPYFLSPNGLVTGNTGPDISHWIHIWRTTSQTYKMSLSWHHGWVFIRQSHCYTRPAATGYMIYGKVRESYDCAHCYTSFTKYKSLSGNMMQVPRGYNGNSFRWYGRGTRKINSLAKGLMPIIMSCCPTPPPPPPWSKRDWLGSTRHLIAHWKVLSFGLCFLLFGHIGATVARSVLVRRSHVIRPKPSLESQHHSFDGFMAVEESADS